MYKGLMTLSEFKSIMASDGYPMYYTDLIPSDYVYLGNGACLDDSGIINSSDIPDESNWTLTSESEDIVLSNSHKCKVCVYNTEIGELILVRYLNGFEAPEFFVSTEVADALVRLASNDLGKLVIRLNWDSDEPYYSISFETPPYMSKLSDLMESSVIVGISNIISKSRIPSEYQVEFIKYGKSISDLEVNLGIKFNMIHEIPGLYLLRPSKLRYVKIKSPYMGFPDIRDYSTDSESEYGEEGLTAINLIPQGYYYLGDGLEVINKYISGNSIPNVNTLPILEILYDTSKSTRFNDGYIRPYEGVELIRYKVSIGNLMVLYIHSKLGITTSKYIGDMDFINSILK